MCVCVCVCGWVVWVVCEHVVYVRGGVCVQVYVFSVVYMCKHMVCVGQVLSVCSMCVCVYVFSVYMCDMKGGRCRQCHHHVWCVVCVEVDTSVQVLLSL